MRRIVRQALVRASAATVMCAAVVIPAWSQAAAPSHPSFAGTWRFDAEKSEASTFNPASGTYLVRQTADSFVIDRETTGATGTVTKAHMVYGFDGKPWKNSLPLVGQSVEQSSVLSWAGDTLVIHSTAQAGDADLVQTDRWSLSADGRTLSIKRQATYDGNAIGSPTWIFNRTP